MKMLPSRRAGEPHGDDVEQLRPVAEPLGLRQRAEQRQPHREAEQHEARVLEGVHGLPSRAPPGRAPAGARRTGRPPTARTPRPGAPARAAGARRGWRAPAAAAARSGRAPSAARPGRPSSRAGAMCASTSSPPMWASGVTSAATISAMPAPKHAMRHAGTGRPWRAERARPHPVGGQRRQRRQQLQRLEDAAPDVRERGDHRIEHTPAGPHAATLRSASGSAKRAVRLASARICAQRRLADLDVRLDHDLHPPGRALELPASRHAPVDGDRLVAAQREPQRPSSGGMIRSRSA